MGIAAAAAVIGIVALLALRRPQAVRLAVIGIAASPAHQQSLQEVALASARLTVVSAIFGELLLNSGEQVAVNERRNRHSQPFLLGHIRGAIGPTRLFRAAAHRPQPLAHRPDPGLAKSRRPDIGRVLENAPYGRPIPGRLAAAGQETVLP